MGDVYIDFLINRLKYLRESAELTQEIVAELAGLSYKHYQSIESGRKREIRVTTLYRLAKAYELEAWELLYSQPPRLSPKFLRKIKRIRSRD